jgi:CRP-like cAMP-binding protein
MSRRLRPQGEVRKHERSQGTKALAASALAQKIGYLRVEELPNTHMFETLPAQSFSANRIIRGTDKLFLLRHGVVEIWHTSHDTLVKELKPGVLFGDMALLGQTMLGTKAITGTPGATVTVIDADTVKEWIKTAPVPIVEKIGHRLADIEGEHYRSRFQLADSRIAAMLLELAGEGSHVLGLTHEEMGEKIGVYRETVTNMLDAMKSERLIEIGRKRITILDKRALKELSEL